MKTLPTGSWLAFMAAAFFLGGTITCVAFIKGETSPVRDSAIRLLKACSGQVEITQSAAGSLLIGCGPAPVEQKMEPTRGSEV